MADEFIQFKRKVFAQAQSIATAAGTDHAFIESGLLHLWDHCYERRKNVETMAIVSAGIVSAMFRRLPVIELLIDYGFIVKEGDAYRVKGTDCYVAKVIAGRAGGDASAGKRKENQDVAKHPQAEPKQKASRTQAEGKQNPSRAQANDEKEPSATPVLAPEPKQNQPEYRVKISPTERDLSSHESPVTGPPQHAPGRGRAVAPPKPEPEPEPEWQPPPHCPAGHILASYEVRAGTCSCCARVERERVALEKQRAADALRERVRSIPMPPRPAESDYEPDSDDFLRALHAWALRKVDREKGVDWREAML